MRAGILNSTAKGSFFFCVLPRLVLGSPVDLIVKAGSSGIADVAKFQFIGTMTKTVSWLRRQDALIRRMKCKCPYLIQVRF
jgi:hypothetical protein